MRSRRGKELFPNQKLQNQIGEKETLLYYESISAIPRLDEYIAAFTHDRVPQELLKSRDAIKKAKKPEEISEFLLSPYKIVKDAASDKIRILNKLPPNSKSAIWFSRWGQIVDGRIAPQLMAAPGMFASRNETFNAVEHGLGRVPGNLAGSVSESYEAHTHHLQARLLGGDGDLKQTNSDTRVKPKMPYKSLS